MRSVTRRRRTVAADSVSFLRSRAVPLAPGLTAAELSTIEHRFGFAFSPDHRDFLSLALPRGDRWVDWRGEDGSIEDALSRPIEGIVFDVEENAFWPPSWGEAPQSLPERSRRAREQLATWPTLVPLYGHRYLPASPAPAGAPVFSVWQSDVIVYGRDLLDYVRHEFGGARTARSAGGVDAASCPPWSLLAFGREEDL